MELQSLFIDTAKALVSRGSGILAVDESPKSLTDLFIRSGVENNEENRNRYREVLLMGSTPNVSGVILHEETTSQATKEGITFIEALKLRGIIVGVKLDKGLEEDVDGGTLTMGLGDLRERVQKYEQLGCKFAKWRCVFKITENGPSMKNVKMNMETMAEFASICQKGGLLPIVEPEILRTGDHTLKHAQYLTELILSYLLLSLKKHRVSLQAIIYKVGMVLPGVDNIDHVTSNDIAKATVEALMATVPPTVPGIVFLSGGQSPEEATHNLSKICSYANSTPWPLTFCFGRAVQIPAFEAWAYQKGVQKARNELRKRLIANAAATLGLDDFAL